MALIEKNNQSCDFPNQIAIRAVRVFTPNSATGSVTYLRTVIGLWPVDMANRSVSNEPGMHQDAADY
jgi:hypothetical protein